MTTLGPFYITTYSQKTNNQDNICSTPNTLELRYLFTRPTAGVSGPVEIATASEFDVDQNITFYLQYYRPSDYSCKISENESGGPLLTGATESGREVVKFAKIDDYDASYRPEWTIYLPDKSGGKKISFIPASSFPTDKTTRALVENEPGTWWINHDKTKMSQPNPDNLYLDNLTTGEYPPVPSGPATCDYIFNFTPVIKTNTTYNIIAQSTETNADTVSIEKTMEKNGDEEFLRLDFYSSSCDFHNMCTPKVLVGGIRAKRYNRRLHTILASSGMFSGIRDDDGGSFYLKQISEGFFYMKFPGHAFIISDKINTPFIKNQGIVNKLNKKYSLNLKLR